MKDGCAENFDASDYRTAGNALMLIFGGSGSKLYRVIIQALAMAAYAMEQRPDMMKEQANDPGSEKAD